MPLYELLCITRKLPVGDMSKAKSLAKQAALHVLDNGGVVRSLNYLGSQRLPYRMRKGKEIHVDGTYWTLQFHSNPETMTGVRNLLDFDMDVIKQNVVKVGSALNEISGRQDGH